MATGTDRNAVSPPAGTGNAPGLGEAFQLDLNTGQGSYALALPLPEGIAGWRPELKLQYRHGSGPSAFGLGWQLAVRRIDRRLDFGVPDSSAGSAERFLDGGSELVAVGGGEFRARFESAFTRWRRSGDGWVVDERSGVRHEVGLTPGARVADPSDPTRVTSWLVERSLDTSGNAIEYGWMHDEGTAYLARVRYATYTVTIDYEDRPDEHRNGRTGTRRVLRKRARRVALAVTTPAGERTVRSWTIGYDVDPWSGLSLLTSLQLRSHGPAPDGSDDVVRPPQRFGYSALEPSRWHARFVDGESPPPLSDPDSALVALDDDALPGVLHVRNGRHTYWRNEGGSHWGDPVVLKDTPVGAGLGRSGVALLDIDGNATADLFVGVGGRTVTGYYENGGREGWRRFVAYPRQRRAAPPFASGRVRLGDIDGDGRVDATYSGGRVYATWVNRAENGWSDPLVVPKGDGVSAPDVDFDDPWVRFADMSGDGMPDLVRLRSGRVEVWPALGNGRYGPLEVMRESPRLPSDADPEQVVLADLDGDGTADLAVVGPAGVTVHLNRSGQEWSAPIHDPLVPPPIRGTVRVADLAGRGRAGLVWNSRRSGRTAYVAYDLGHGDPPYLLTHVDNGAGLASEIEYRSSVEDAVRDRALGDPWTTYLPFPVTVVAATRERDVVTGQVAESRYRYHDGHFDVTSRQFQGFARVEKIETGDESRPDGRTVFFFRMGEDRLPGNGREHAALNRMLRRVEVYGADGSPDEGRPFHVEETDHDLQVLATAADGGQRVFVTVRRSVHTILERTDEARGEERTYDYDDVGNVIRERRRAFGVAPSGAPPEQVVVTEVTYARNDARHVLDRPARIVKRDAAGTLLAEVHRYYDGPDYEGLPMGSVERGRLTRETEWVLTRADFDAHYGPQQPGDLHYGTEDDADGRPGVFAPRSRKRFDAAGRVTGERSVAGAETAYEFGADGLHVARQTGPLGTTRFETDPVTAQVTRVTEEDGTVVETGYDAQGRVRWVVLPGDTPALPTRTYTYDDASLPVAVRVSYRRAHGRPETLDTAVYFDGHQKEAQRRVTLDPGRIVVSGWTVRNPWGDPAREYEPTFGADLAFAIPALAGRASRRFRYDADGRPVETVDYTGGRSRIAIRPFEITTWDANDSDDSPENVARGQFDTPRRERVDAAGNRVAIVEQGASGPVTTTFEIGLLGELLSITDDHGEVARYTTDRRGCRLTIHHREAGDRELFYDAQRRVVRTRSGGGAEIEARFDAGDRIVELRAGGVATESYVYDHLPTNGHGRLREVTYPGGAQVFEYNRRGQVVRQTWRDDNLGTSHTLGFEYDALGKQRRVTYPDGSTVEYEHYANGVPRSIPGFVDRIDYDARMLPTRIAYANGVVTETTYTAGPGRVATQRTVAPSGVVLEDRAFTYDARQQLLRLDDATPGATGVVSYGYDPLYQLTTVDDARPAGGAVSNRYAYDGRWLVEMGETGVRLAHDDAAHPGRPGRLERPGTGAAPFVLAYDADGNLTSLPGRSFSYDAKNQLERVRRDDGTVVDYTYDHKGSRVRKRVDPGGGRPADETLFLGPFAEVRRGQIGRYVLLGGTRLALVRAGRTRWFHADHLGTVELFTDETGAPIARLAYQPFGNTAPAAGDATRVFALHEWDDDAGLYFMQRRYYAPEMGRFLTPDGLHLYRPDQGLDDPRALELYTYVANDPVNNVDPTGRSFWSVVGAVVGVIVGIAAAILIIAAFASGIGWALLAIAGLIAFVTGCYVLASATQGSDFGEFMRGFLIGFNAGLNATLLVAAGIAIGGPLGVVVGVVGVVVGIINFLAAFDTIAASDVYQGILGWSNWLMPMSWLIVALGLVFFIVNALPALFTLNQVDAVKIDKVFVDWKTGTIFVKGGWVSNLNAWDTAFNMGNFAFIDTNSPSDHVEHEAGHTLNLGAFGSVFHLVGFFDEVVLGNGRNAYAEQIAESNDPAASGPTIPMWV